LDSTYQFGPFRLHVGSRQLLLRGVPLVLYGRAFEVLVALVRRRGHLASKQAVLDEVWPGIAVEENNVATQVFNLRRLFKQHDPGAEYIVTDAGRGYRFVAEVSVLATEAPAEPDPPAPCPVAAADVPGMWEIPATLQNEQTDRRLAAILSADVVEYSRMIAEDEQGTMARMDSVRRDIVDPAVGMFRGRIFKELGDGLLVDFPSAVLALSAALRIQNEVAARNGPRPGRNAIIFRIGVHQGDVLVRGADLFGDGVNVTKRLETLARPGGICVSDRVRDDVRGRLQDLEFDDLGDVALKNIARPVRAHLVCSALWPHPVVPAEPRPQEMPAPAPSATEIFCDGRGEHPQSGNLPQHEATSFIGREGEIELITRALLDRRRLTLVGSGGVGKTRTALRAGAAAQPSFRDGVWLVELAPLADAGLVAEAVCRALSAPVSGTRSPVEIAVAFLRQKQCLLILDNCEHLRDAAAELVNALLSQCPDVSILATSRERLHIAGEVVFKLPSLPFPGPSEGASADDAMRFASVRLFVQRAADAVGGYVLTDIDAPSVSAICRRLDGVAMAIELAAARRTVLKPAEIAARLENAFRLLNSGGHATLPRHRTLWATIDWSHSLLAPAEQMLLRRLSVFVDGFSEEGAIAAAVGDGIDAEDVMDLLILLVDKSLVNADMTGAATRYRMLEATRHYAREKLKASGETGRDRLAAEYLADFYARAEADWPTMPTEAWLDHYAPEVENLRAAIDWAFGQSQKYHAVAGDSGDPALGILLVSRAGLITEEMSRQADIKRWAAMAMRHITPATPPAQAGWVRFWPIRWETVFSVADVSPERRAVIDLFRTAGDAVGLSCALRTTAITLIRPGQIHPEVEPMLREAAALLHASDVSKDLATVLAHTGYFHFSMGDLDSGRRCSQQALAMRRALGDRTGCLASAVNLAEFEFISGNTPAAIRYANEAVADARRAGHLPTLANLRTNLAGYLLSMDQVAEARQAACEALSLNRALDHHGHALPCVEHLALAHALSGNFQDAARLLGYTESHYRRTGQVRDLAEQRGHDRLVTRLRETLSEAALEILMAEGAGWPDAVADRVAKGDGSRLDQAASAA
jgi:predicted ATPase/class 3 adenylate cyclase